MDSELEVQHFKKMNERFKAPLENKSIYIKNIPSSVKKIEDLKKIFSKFGKISWGELYQDTAERPYAILDFETAESVGETMIHIESESPAEPYVIVHFEKCSDGVILIGSSPFHHVSVYCVAAAVETVQSIICAQPCKPITIPERTKNGIIAKSVGHHKFPKSRSSISGFRIDGLQTHAYKY